MSHAARVVRRCRARVEPMPRTGRSWSVIPIGAALVLTYVRPFSASAGTEREGICGPLRDAPSRSAGGIARRPSYTPGEVDRLIRREAGGARDSRRSTGYTQITLQFALNRRHRRRGSRTCRPRSTRAARQLPPAHAIAADLSRRPIPADAPILVLGADARTTLPITTVDDYAETHPRAEAVAGSAASALVQRSAASSIRRCASSSIRRSSPRTASISRTCATALSNVNVNQPKGSHVRPDRAPIPCTTNDQLLRPQLTGTTRSSPTATAARCGCHDVGADGIDRTRRTNAAAGWASSARSRSAFSGSPAPTSSRRWTRSGRSCRSSSSRCRRPSISRC